MKTTKKLFMLFFAIGTFALTSCNNNERRDTNNEMGNDSIRVADENRMNQERMDRENNSVQALVQQDTVLTTFSRNIESNQLAQTFREEEGPYTIFAPSNVAYNTLSQEERDNFTSGQNMDENSARLFYLVVDEELTSDELREEIESSDGTYTLQTMQGEEITATLQGENVVLTDGAGNTATLTSSDIDASNGVIHVIDGVLEPTDASTNDAANMNRNNQMRSTNQNNAGTMDNTSNQRNTGNQNTTGTQNNTGNTGNMNNTGNVDGTGDRSNTGNTDDSDIQPGSQNAGNQSTRNDINQ